MNYNVIQGDLDSCLAKSKEIIDAHTIQLKWVTPKISVTGGCAG